MIDTPINERRIRHQSDKTSATVHDVFAMLEREESAFRQKGPEDQQNYKELLGQFTESNNSLGIEGSKRLITAFNEINDQKADYVVPLKDIQVIDFPQSGHTGKRELEFELLSYDHQGKVATAFTIYEARKQFLDKTFKANKHYEELFDRDATEFAINSIRKLIEQYPDDKYRFRFVIAESEEKEQYYLRAVVDPKRYHIYDNGAILFLSLLGMERYSRDSKQLFYVDSAVLTESKINLSLKSRQKILLDNGVSIRIGVTIRNSEIADESAEFIFIYWISYQGKTITLIDRPLFKINHGYTAATNAKELQNLDEIANRTNEVYEAVNIAKVYNPMEAGSLEHLFSSLLHAGSALSNKYRSKVTQFRFEVVQNTYSLFELFDKLESFADDLDDDQVIWEIRARLSKYLLE